METIKNILLFPLKELYFNGPYFHGFGFWQGMQSSKICSILTSSDEQIWYNNDEACDDIIDKHFNAFLTLFICCFVLYLYVMVIMNFPKIMYFCIRCCYSTRLNLQQDKKKLINLQ